MRLVVRSWTRQHVQLRRHLSPVGSPLVEVACLLELVSTPVFLRVRRRPFVCFFGLGFGIMSVSEQEIRVQFVCIRQQLIVVVVVVRRLQGYSR
jgi:hypothetical protein